MKNIKQYIPLFMVLLMVLSIYYFFDAIETENKQYQTYIANGDNFFKEKLYVKAVNEYAKAQAMRNSIEVDKKEADCYEIQELTRDTAKLYETMLEKYPKSVKAYEYAMEYFMRAEDYGSVYSIYHTSQKRKITSKKISKIVHQIQYSYYLTAISYKDVKDGFNGYHMVQAENELWGLAGENGAGVLRCEYLNIGNYYTECIPVKTEENEVYFVDINGNRALNYKGEETAEELGIVTGNVYWAKIGDSYSFYNLEGKKISEDYQKVTNQNGGITLVQQNDKWKLVDEEFHQIGEDTYAGIIVDEAGFGIRKGCAFANLLGKGYQLMDSKGKLLSKDYYSNARLMVDGTAAAVEQDGKWGFVDGKGKMVIEPKYEDAKSFSNGFAAVKQNGKWGFINLENKMVIEPLFDDAKSFSEDGQCFVKLEDKWNVLRLYAYN